MESLKQYSKLNRLSELGIEGIDLKKVKFNWAKANEKAKENSKQVKTEIELMLHKHGVDFENGNTVITGKNSIKINNRLIEADNILIATGSLPNKAKSDKSIGIAEIYKKDDLPEEIVVEGNGPVAVEFAQMLNMAGVKVYFNHNSEKLIPGADEYINNYLISKLKSEGIIFAKENKIPKGLTHLNANMRKAVVPENNLKIALDESGFVAVNEFLQTNIKNIYAVGDVNGKSYLAHAASAQALFAVNHIAGIKGKIRHDRYPMNIYTYPEIAQIGKTEQELKQEGIEYKISSFSFSSNAKALIKGENEGEIRILSESKYGEVLGVQIISENATDMIAEAAAYIEMEATIYDVAKTIHAHPTISEVFVEAARKSDE
ncbi:MAG: NAD(P)/FAD-dependent oxidoreductase [Bacteroidales bacterium]|nr:NAD(P)/FAD-dependent oxidoreductase [Bacteroidales bacterium]